MRPLLLLSLLPFAACAADYAGAASCAKCHPAESAQQSATGHAHALVPSSPNQPGDWAFGAGAQAITFVSRTDRDHYREHGETWYRSLNGYALTPGHRTSAGLDFRLFDSDARLLRCFACHSTGPLALGDDDRVTPHELGVRCEVCHGPAALHAANPAQNHPRNPAQLSAAKLNDFCGQCHRLILEDGEEDTDLRDPGNSRNQPRLLAASACFRKSKTGIGCTACHQPHAPLQRNAAAYDAPCRGCHAAVKHTQAVGGSACVECHMPSVQLSNLAFTNHRIAVYAAADPMSPVSLKPSIKPPLPGRQ
jgi:hypothetical protein